MVISLIGYRGTGKSTVGRRLAERLGWTWIDTDTCIQARAGKSIRRIFEEDGEDAFRDLESAAVAEHVRTPHVVLSLGGGVVLRDANQQLLRSAGPVIWLVATPATLRTRIGEDPRTAEQRPPLSGRTSGATAENEIERVLAARRPLYDACATHQVITDGLVPAEIVETILRLLEIETTSPSAER